MPLKLNVLGSVTCGGGAQRINTGGVNMETYGNRSGKSNVEAYSLIEQGIIDKFKSGNDQYYRYTNFSAGSQAIDYMQGLAQDGLGLNSYISRNQPGYASKSHSLALL